MNKGFSFLFLIIIIIFGCNSKTTDKKNSATNDSIQKYLALAGNDTLAFNKRIKYTEKALGYVDLEKNDSIKRKTLYVIAFYYHIFNEKEESRKVAEQLLALSLKAKDSLSLALAYRTLGLYSVSISENEKAIEYFFKAKKLFSNLKNTDYVLKVMMDIAITQSYACDFLGSNNTAFKTLSLAGKFNMHQLDFKLKKIIANNLSSLKQNDKAIEYFLNLDKNYSDYNEKHEIQIEIASCYIDIGQYDEAYFYLNMFLQNKKNKNLDPSNYAQCLSLLGLYKTLKGDYNQLPQLFYTADSIFSAVNSLTAKNYNQIYLSKYYFKRKDTLSAVNAAKKALEISTGYKNPGDVLLSLDQLIAVDKKHAQTYAKQYIQINDSMQVAERNFRDRFARVAFETNAITQQKDTAVKQRSIVIAIAFMLIFIIILFFIIARQRLKQKELLLQQTEQNASEEIFQLILTLKNKEEQARQIEKRRIGQDLHDGIMNKLASTRLNLSILSINRDNSTIDRCIKYINDIQNIEKEIRNIAHDLNQEVFAQADSFGKLLEDFVLEQNQTGSTSFVLEIDHAVNWNTIANDKKINLYRIIQEACHNIKKHANASKAIVSILIDGTNICLTITDDGIGFDPAVSTKGIGLINIEHRVKQLKGKFSINSVPNATTAVNICIPLQELK